MAAQVTNYKCPACTGPLHFDGSTGKLTCDYCGSSYDVAEMDARYARKEAEAAQASAAQESREQAQRQQTQQDGGWDYSQMTSDWGRDGEKMRAYSCPSCGAELVCEETTAATSCPYCGNPTIVPGNFSGSLRPDYVIPFKLDKAAAEAALKEHYKGKMFLPRSFCSSNRIQEVKGVYVPFWLFDGTVDVDMELEATRVRSYSDGEDDVVETSYYLLRRRGAVTFQRIPADGSSKMPDGHMDSIEPFDYSELKSFSTAYLPGYLADKYDVSAQDCAQRADERAKNTARETIASTAVGYSSVHVMRENNRLHRGAVHYALLPVWMLNTKWEGKDFLFAMNGQTGRLVGDLPISRKRFWAWWAGLSAGLTALFTVILTLSGLG